MAYIPTVWAPGDVIAAEKLNKAEEGIAANSENVVYIDLVYNSTSQKYETDYQLSDALAALDEEKILIFRDSSSYEGVTAYYYVCEHSSTYICFTGIYNAGGTPPALALIGYKWESTGINSWPSLA